MSITWKTAGKYFAAILVVVLGLFAAQRTNIVQRTKRGTSVVVLIDFSRTVVPLGRPDERALKSLTAAFTELATESWVTPITFSWAPISSASLGSIPAFNTGPCAPLEFEQKLIKNDQTIDKSALNQRLDKCAEQLVAASANSANWTQWTDISGAIRLAAESARDNSETKVLVVFSDFRESLPLNAKPVPLQMYGEQVLLLDRPGTDDSRIAVSEYLNRVDEWASNLRMHGARQTYRVPVFGATTNRLARGLVAQPQSTGTAALVVVSSATSSSRTGSLKPIAAALSQLAKTWIPPVTVTWVGLEDSAFSARWLPPIEFAPTLIKTQGALSPEGLRIELDQSAAGMERLRSSESTADLAGMLALGWAANQAEDNRVLIVVSDFRDSTYLAGVPSLQLQAARVVMVGTSAESDLLNQADYYNRLDRWERTFRTKQSAFACRLQLENITVNSLVNCLSDSR